MIREAQGTGSVPFFYKNKQFIKSLFQDKNEKTREKKRK